MAEKRTTSIPVRLSPSEVKTLKTLAWREGLTSSEMLRQALRESAQKRGIYSIGLISILGEREIEISHEKSQ